MALGNLAPRPRATERRRVGGSTGSFPARPGGDEYTLSVPTFYWPQSVTCSDLDATGGGGDLGNVFSHLEERRIAYRKYQQRQQPSKGERASPSISGLHSLPESTSPRGLDGLLSLSALSSPQCDGSFLPPLSD